MRSLLRALACATLSAASLASAATLTVVKAFDSSTCSLPMASMLLTADGSLYGTCLGSGTGRGGILFRLDTTGQFSVLHQFSYNDSTDASEPIGGLLQGQDGLLWGSSQGGGGSDNHGTVYRIGTDGSGFTLVKVFSAEDGTFPSALIQDAQGKVYGTTNQGGGRRIKGTVFSVSPSGDFTRLLGVRTALDVTWPAGGLTWGPDGFLYGLGSSGYSTRTTGGAGSLYRIRPDGTGFQRMVSFQTPSQGYGPMGELLLASDGWLYGVTYQGGQHGQGTVFRWNPSDGSFALVHEFAGGPGEGANPSGGLVQGADGALYGVTASGGSAGSGLVGTVYRLTLAGQYTLLHSFDTTSAAGYYPTDRLTPAPDGSLYGTTWHGPDGLPGTVFRVQP